MIAWLSPQILLEQIVVKIYLHLKTCLQIIKEMDI